MHINTKKDDKILPLCRPVINDISRIKILLESGKLSTGEVVREFEQKIAAFLNIEDAVAVSSGTAAIFISLLAAGIKRGDEVILPDFTFPAAAHCADLLGLKIVPVDIDSETFNMRTDLVLKAISRRTKAVIAVHEFGIPFPVDEITGELKERRIFLIEDAACAFGGKINGKFLGTSGDAGCFSFHPRKILTTAEGGCIISKDMGFMNLSRILRNQGRSSSNTLNPFSCAGFNFRMSDIHAAIGLSQMDSMGKNLLKRKKIINRYVKALQNSDVVHVPSCYAENLQSAFQSFTVLCRNGKHRDRLMDHLKNLKIESAPGAFALHLQPYYRKKYSLKPQSYRGSRDAAEKSLSLPFFQQMTEDDVMRVADAIERFRS
jgi:dTDP-4-amino-4,6-dideoxygalactose transaminase